MSFVKENGRTIPVADKVFHPCIIAKQTVQAEFVQSVTGLALYLFAEIDFEAVSPAFLLSVCHKVQTGEAFGREGNIADCFAVNDDIGSILCLADRISQQC